MNLPTWYDAGTVSVATGSAIVTGFNNLWGGDAIMVGDLFCDPAQPLIPPQRVKSAKDGELELWTGWPGAPLVKALYEVRYVGIIERSTAQSRKVLEQLGEVDAWYDIMVEDNAARLALETANSPLRANYRVLVKTPGVIWAKKSGAFGDWIGPVEFRGPIGERGPIGPIGITWRFAYDAATAYAINDGVSLNGSSFRKRTAAPAGTAPSSANPPVHTADWEVLAAKGKDGTGTGDFVGPATAIADRLVAFDGATGKQGKDSGIAFDAVMLKSTPITNAQALPGGVIGSALSKFFSYYGSGNVIPVGGAAPTDAQGDAIIGISYTPRAAGNKIRCRAVIPCTRGNAGNILATITRSGSAAALALGISTVASAGEQKLIVLQDEFVTTSETAIMISLRVGPGDSGGVMYINGNQTQGFFGGVWGATLSVEEIKG